MFELKEVSIYYEQSFGGKCKFPIIRDYKINYKCVGRLLSWNK